VKKALCTPDAAPDDSFGTSGKEKVTSFCHLLLQLVILIPNVRDRANDVQTLNLFEDLFFAIKKARSSECILFATQRDPILYSILSFKRENTNCLSSKKDL